LASTRKLDLL
jgi:hypothetical protein